MLTPVRNVSDSVYVGKFTRY